MLVAGTEKVLVNKRDEHPWIADLSVEELAESDELEELELELDDELEEEADSDKKLLRLTGLAWAAKTGLSMYSSFTASSFLTSSFFLNSSWFRFDSRAIAAKSSKDIFIDEIRVDLAENDAVKAVLEAVFRGSIARYHLVSIFQVEDSQNIEKSV